MSTRGWHAMRRRYSAGGGRRAPRRLRPALLVQPWLLVSSCLPSRVQGEQGQLTRDLKHFEN